jgi:uncharacterized membrane protein YdjX (TVP38/TMEM64 family)
MKNIKKYTPIIILIMLMIIAGCLIDTQSISLYKNYLTEYKNSSPIICAIIYLFVYIISVALSLPIATILTLLAGVIFGPIYGTIIVITGATFGAIIVFLIVKNTSKNLSFLNKYTKSKSLLTLQNNLKENAVSYLLFARLVPLFPFVLVNIAPATIGIKTSTFFWTTFMGIAPGSFIYTYLGYQSGNINSVSDLISKEMLLALTLLGVFSLIPILIKKRDKKNA